jgi:CheY-like chemotaxis protein
MSESLHFPIEDKDPPGRILVAEDLGPLRGALRELLQDAGFVVKEAADGVQAVEAAGRFMPDVTIMDLRMPGWDGLEATLQLKAQDPDSQVIVFSATEDAATKELAKDEGVFCFLRKGVAPDQILDAVSRALAYKRRLEAVCDG